MKDPTDDEYNWTKEFRSVWAEFIPKSQYSTFDAGGWFTTEFGDVVVGIVYGHMNIDHFILQDSDEAEILDDSSSLQFPTMSFDNSDESDHWFLKYLYSLREDWSKLPPEDMDDPWLRDEDAAFGLPSPDIIINDDQSIEKKGKEEKTKQLLFKVPEHQSSCPPPGPAYLNQPLTWLGCIQYFANITKINNRMSKTHGLKDNSGNFTDAEVNEASKTSHDYNDDDLIFEVEYDTSEDDIYRMDDLTVRSFLDLAIQIGKGYKDPSVSKMNIGGLATSNIGAIRSDEFDIKKRKEKKSRNKDTAWRTFFRRATVGF
ncbi:Endopolyphosphatase [Aspergillus tanneri]|uniref:Endopolyphosphatase n=1 Tax=Aspergillus tanneri TaxID=1220188 RepID=A0A5M9MAC6_9EURO|nr:Endopolyphosphatase [Aspergillus tanneri]KAA8641499.1 Endopolyphosphatase [Aspergillus tanneri]